MTYWDNYTTHPQKYTHKSPSSYLLEALQYCHKRDAALDFGAGALVDTRYLLDNHFKNVVAIDGSAISKTLSKDILHPHFSFIHADFRDFTPPINTYNIINAQYSLPFYGANGFDMFLDAMIHALTDDGIFVGQLFGKDDGWHSNDSIVTFHSYCEVQYLLRNMDVIAFVEEKKHKNTMSGEHKLWHLFHFIARKKHYSTSL